MTLKARSSETVAKGIGSEPSDPDADDDGGDEDTAPQQTDANDNNENDLIIRDGFPALWEAVPDEGKTSEVKGDEVDSKQVKVQKRRPLIEGDEPTPRHPFWSHESVFSYDPDSFAKLCDDCERVFTAREKESPDQAYSTGQTFFLPATATPRCALEGIVKTIFEKHVAHLEPGMYNPAQSGAEWWTLVLDNEDHEASKISEQKEGEDDEDDEDDPKDEVGLHFDADYELEDQAPNLLLHPRIATVTYLSSRGAPTMVFDRKSPPPSDLQKLELQGDIERAWLSHPVIGKHTAFDGRLLHGAPAFFFPGHTPASSAGDKEPSAKRAKQSNKRTTLLVNIWLNHWVMDASLLEESVCASLTTPWEAPITPEEGQKKGNMKGDDSYRTPFKWNDDVDLSQPPNANKVELKYSTVDPAGEDSIALCNRSVTVKYNPHISECHAASRSASTVELAFATNALTLEVGDELPDASEDENEDE